MTKVWVPVLACLGKKKKKIYIYIYIFFDKETEGREESKAFITKAEYMHGQAQIKVVPLGNMSHL